MCCALGRSDLQKGIGLLRTSCRKVVLFADHFLTGQSVVEVGNDLQKGTGLLLTSCSKVVLFSGDFLTGQSSLCEECKGGCKEMKYYISTLFGTLALSYCFVDTFYCFVGTCL